MVIRGRKKQFTESQEWFLALLVLKIRNTTVIIRLINTKKSHTKQLLTKLKKNRCIDLFTKNEQVLKYYTLHLYKNIDAIMKTGSKEKLLLYWEK